MRSRQYYLMNHKRRRSVSSASSLDSSLNSSSLDSSGSSELANHHLSRKDLLKLIKLEKAVKREEALLKKQKQLHHRRKDQLKWNAKVDKIYEKHLNKPMIEEGSKLFITGIDDQHSYDSVMSELKVLLKEIPGVIGLRVKQKKGSRTYAFVDFSNKADAAEALLRLRKKELFGDKVSIYYSQDELKNKNQDTNKGKKCFECKEHGHFARECIKSKKGSSMKDSSFDQALYSQEDKGHYQFEKTKKEEEQNPNKKVTRDKNRLHRLGGLGN